MGLGEHIDFAALLEPCSESNPAGSYLEPSSELKFAVQAERERERNIFLQKIQGPPPKWSEVIDRCKDALAKQTKDLQLAVWLCEGLVKLHGFAGLRDGLHFLHEMSLKFWDTMYPPLTDPSARKSLVSFSSSKDTLSPPPSLPALVRLAPITKATEFCSLTDSRNSPDEFLKRALGSPPDFYEKLTVELTDCKREFDDFQSFLESKFDDQSKPNLGELDTALVDCLATVNGTPKRSPAGSSTSGQLTSAATGSQGKNAPLVSCATREEAFAQLSSIADYLKNHEPHHPVTFLVQRAVRWTMLPFEEWLVEVVNDPGTLKHVQETLGIIPKAQPPDGEA